MSEAQEPREFWIDDITLKVCGPWSEAKDMNWPDSEEVIHVIEKSAYDKLVEENERLKAKVQELQDFLYIKDLVMSGVERDF